jgi:hypothetical protein
MDIAFSPDGSTLAWSGVGSEVRLLDAGPLSMTSTELYDSITGRYRGAAHRPQEVR